MSAAAIHDPTHAYRRTARKLRGRFADRPLELYRSLRELSDHHDQIRDVAAISEPSTPTSEFGTEVREFLQQGLITYSSRQDLLKSAEMHGIPRFEANLIIAAMQHRVAAISTELSPPAVSRLPIVLGFVISQIALLATLWAIVAR